MKPRIQLNQKIAVSVVFVAAMFMAIMDITIVNVALPSIGREFHESTASLDSVVVGFLVSLAIFIPAAGWLGDRFGMKRMLLIAIAVFTGASALCGLAQSLPELVVFRVIQGVGGGMLTPVGMALLYRTFPPSERVRAASILTTPTAVAPAVGPVLGGLLVTDFTWRWVFYVNLPIGALAIAFGFLCLEEQREPARGRFDLPGFLLSGIGFALVMFGVSDAPARGWGDSLIIGSIALGAVLIAVMVWFELRIKEPLLRLRLFGNRLFRSGSLVLVLSVAAFLGVLFVAPLFFQIGLGLSALQSGLNTFPEAIGIMIGAQFASRLFYPRFGPRRLIAIGLLGRGHRHGAHDPDRIDRRPLVDAGVDVFDGAVPGAVLHRRAGGVVRHGVPRGHGAGLVAVQQPEAAGKRSRGGTALERAGIRRHGAGGRRPPRVRSCRIPRRLPRRRRDRLVGVDDRAQDPRCRRRGHDGAPSSNQGRRVGGGGRRTHSSLSNWNRTTDIRNRPSTTQPTHSQR